MKTFALAVFVTFGFALGPNLVNAKVHECEMRSLLFLPKMLEPSKLILRRRVEQRI